MLAFPGDYIDRQTCPIRPGIANALRLAEPPEKNVTDRNPSPRHSLFVTQNST